MQPTACPELVEGAQAVGHVDQKAISPGGAEKITAIQTPEERLRTF